LLTLVYVIGKTSLECRFNGGNLQESCWGDYAIDRLKLWMIKTHTIISF